MLACGQPVCINLTRLKVTSMHLLSSPSIACSVWVISIDLRCAPYLVRHYQPVLTIFNIPAECLLKLLGLAVCTYETNLKPSKLFALNFILRSTAEVLENFQLTLRSGNNKYCFGVYVERRWLMCLSGRKY